MNEPTPAKSSGMGALAVIGGLLVSMAIGAIPTIAGFVSEQNELQQQEAERREEIKRQFQKLQQEAKRGDVHVGPAFRSLMGEPAKD